uniref:Uncharacterized protein n=2 Tax=Chenopodium quinoa TaxID=63459 RepID=A0A803KW85_CHEQI
MHLRERRPEKLHYIGVSFGLTLDLFRFWRKHKFVPFYIGQIPNAVTGEHTCMVLKPLHNDDIEVDASDQLGFLAPFYRDFKQRFSRLLCSNEFRSMEYKLAMSVLDPKINFAESESSGLNMDGFLKTIEEYISPHDMKRLQAYVDNLADYRLILDLVPVLSHLYFQERVPVTLSYAQASVLLCIGLQNQDVSYIEGQMKLERQQILSLFIKGMKKFHKYLYGIATKDVESALPRLKEIVMEPHKITLEEDLDNASKKVKSDMKAKAEGLLDPELLQQFAVEADFEKTLGGKISSSGLVSVKSNKSKPEKKSRVSDSKNEKKRSKDERGNKSNKKRKS